MEACRVVWRPAPAPEYKGSQSYGSMPSGLAFSPQVYGLVELWKHTELFGVQPQPLSIRAGRAMEARQMVLGLVRPKNRSCEIVAPKWSVKLESNHEMESVHFPSTPIRLLSL